MQTIKAGIIGCGNISNIYMENCKKFAVLDLIACADLDLDKAKAQADKHDIPLVCTTEELLAHPEINLVINLTIPAVHAEVSLQALEAGKHVYVEKPLTLTLEQGRKVLDTAAQKGLLVGSAPDTFLGAGIQTALKLISEGTIGRPVSATAFMMSRGHEHWHPDPEFYYAEGGGPMFDMGPYYLTALVQLLGPVRTVAGITSKALTERTITSQKKHGKSIPVDIPTHVAGTMHFDGGAVATLITSFDIFGGSTLPHIEIHGTEGSLLVPDPNGFGGKVMYRKLGQEQWTEEPLVQGYDGNSRGIGPADMADALLHQRKHRANGELAYHVLEAMWAFHLSSDSGSYYNMKSTCEPAVPMAELSFTS
ncbi:Predicted dehydrogenase [Paenibacillus uliginis N3/975]|uniref:Predicted dehydrogenase n=1 Tax=Paenibacillus uliginis N3/975 TaxID=1313296 RepID=A0A1X7HQB3_9BACL|nr:Gfo/Idh/MocA family oxidoreductase [Paenibacillus uliginis]SMF90892.1 Predicted dehydrogenase [Paenibacillus uliginis N3/975]